MKEKHNTCPLCGEAEVFHKRTLDYGSRLLVCGQCDLHFVSPFPSLGQKFYDQDYYRSWGMTNNELPEHVKHLKETNMRKHIQHILRFFTKGNVLEVGCAMGSFLKVAHEEGFNVTGIDLSLQACEIAQKEVPEAKVFHGALETVSFGSDRFDVVFMSDLVEHIPDPLPFWGKIHKLLKNNGIIYVVTPDPMHWSCAIAGSSWVHFKEEHLIFFTKNTMSWLGHKFDLNFIESKHIFKYTNFNYLFTQVRQFGPKPLASGISLVSRFLPEKIKGYLFPLPIGEGRYILQRLT
jgi:2-polyprenyl-3-methyl-5-hydroxy-6-metoxy-1,4-benzoquinol methylase